MGTRPGWLPPAMRFVCDRTIVQRVLHDSEPDLGSLQRFPSVLVGIPAGVCVHEFTAFPEARLRPAIRGRVSSLPIV